MWNVNQIIRNYNQILAKNFTAELQHPIINLRNLDYFSVAIGGTVGFVLSMKYMVGKKV